MKGEERVRKAQWGDLGVDMNVLEERKADEDGG